MELYYGSGKRNARIDVSKKEVNSVCLTVDRSVSLHILCRCLYRNVDVEREGIGRG